MLTYLADSVAGELKLDLLLKTFSQPSQKRPEIDFKWRSS
jgi:hypothetical protein